MPVVRMDGRAGGWSVGRSVYGHVITKFSRMGRLPHILSYGAPPTRGAARVVGRSVYGHVITKFSRMGRLPHILSYGAPPTRGASRRAWSSAIILLYCLSHWTNSNLVPRVFASPGDEVEQIPQFMVEENQFNVNILAKPLSKTRNFALNERC